MYYRIISFLLGFIALFSSLFGGGAVRKEEEAKKNVYTAAGWELTELLMENCGNPVTHKLYKKMDEKGMPFVWSAAAYCETLCDAYRLFPENRALGIWYRDVLLRVFDRYKVENATIEAPSGTYPGVTYYDSGAGHEGDFYYDDNVWVCLQLLHGYRNLGEPSLLAAAEKNLAFLWTGWDDALGGGIYWYKTWKSKNVCSNAPVAAAFLLAYQLTGKELYLARGRMLWDWMNETLLDGDLYNDSIRMDGTVNGWKSAYNQATMIYAGCLLYEITGDEAVFARTRATVNASVGMMFETKENADGSTEIFMRAEPLYKAWCVAWLSRVYVKFYQLDPAKDTAPMDHIIAVLPRELKTKDANGFYDPFFCSGGSDPAYYTEILAQGGVAGVFLTAGYYQTAVCPAHGR